jgi:hypothetical protein
LQKKESYNDYSGSSQTKSRICILNMEEFTIKNC